MVLLRVRLNVGMHRKCDGIFAINYLPYVPLLGSLLPFCLGGDAKSIVLTNQRTPIQNASPNSEREPKFGYASPHSGVCGCALSLPDLLMAVTEFRVIMYAFPQEFHSN